MWHQKAVPGHSIHHILAKSHDGANSQCNLIELKHKTHVAIHQIFSNDNLWEKIKKLIWIEWTALREEVKVKLLKCLQEIWTDDIDYYKPECFK